MSLNYMLVIRENFFNNSKKKSGKIEVELFSYCPISHENWNLIQIFSP